MTIESIQIIVFGKHAIIGTYRNNTNGWTQEKPDVLPCYPTPEIEKKANDSFLQYSFHIFSKPIVVGEKGK